MAQINAPLNSPRPFSQTARAVQPPASGSASSSRLHASRSLPQPHQIINLLPDALSRLRSDISALRTSDTSTAPIDPQTDPAAPPLEQAGLTLTGVRSADASASLSPNARLLLGSAQLDVRSPTIHKKNSESLSESLTVLASSAAIRDTSSIGEFNEISEIFYSLALPIKDLAKGTGLALRHLPSMDLHEKLAIVVELVRAGRRCDEILRYMGISPQPDVYVMEYRLLWEIGMPLIHKGLSCREVEERLGILSGAAVAAFEVEVARRIALPLYRSGDSLQAIEEKLQPTSGSWVHLKSFVRDLEAGREIGTESRSVAASPSVETQVMAAPDRASSPAIERVLAAMALIGAAQNDSAYVRDRI